jgi:hypothetical protein
VMKVNTQGLCGNPGINIKVFLSYEFLSCPFQQSIYIEVT